MTLHPKITTEIANAFPGLEIASALPQITQTGTADLPAYFAATDLAVATIGMAGILLGRLNTPSAEFSVTVDRRLASLWFSLTVNPIGWELPPIWNPISGNYQTQNGWLRLHTNAPKHLAAALAVLDVPATPTAVKQAVAQWEGEALMNAVVAAGGVAATMNTIEDWQAHPQGKAVAQEPLIHWEQHANVTPSKTPGNPAQPLANVRILDLTRILAGPVATRFLAGFGADVLRIDPPNWEEDLAQTEVTLGKRCAGLDLNSAADRATFDALLAEADVLVHGYRPNALASLGYDSQRLRALNPALIDVSLCAYGWTGPWKARRGFDSVMQMSSGISAHGMHATHANAPLQLPAQALDHGTGYLMAAAVLHALAQRNQHGTVHSAKLSLARCAHLLLQTKRSTPGSGVAPATPQDLDPWIEKTTWGKAQRIRFPMQLEGITPQWRYGASQLRSAQPVWLDR